MKSLETKKQKVLWHLRTHSSITSWEAIERYGATRLAAIIFDLKAEGWHIYTKRASKDGSAWAKYILLKDKK